MAKKTRDKYAGTIYACFVGSASQAIILNYAPLLFLTFNSSYGIPLSKITLLVTLCFLLQLMMDAVSAFFVDRVGYRRLIVIAHIASAVGMVMLATLPDLMGDPYTGLVIATVVYSLGSGLLEVLVSPIMESCPTQNKEKAMSLMHSFYCWGQMGTILISTLFFAVFGIQNWRVMTILWAIIPAANAVAFARVPIAPLLEGDKKGMSLRELFSSKLFWMLMLAMVCGGASEQAVSQWASAFVERGLGISKTLGDLLGPAIFAGAMGTCRLLYGKMGDRIHLERFTVLCALLGCASCLLAALSPIPALSLIGCALYGFSVGIYWPGTLAVAPRILRRGGTVMYCMLALGGDMGCSLGPTVVGLVSGANGDDLKIGVLCAVVFPAMMIAAIALRRKMLKKQAVDD